MPGRSASTDVCCHPSTAARVGQPADAAPMTAHQGFKVFSHVVLALMLTAMAYASYIAVAYWTGISV